MDKEQEGLCVLLKHGFLLLLINAESCSSPPPPSNSIYFNHQLNYDYHSPTLWIYQTLPRRNYLQLSKCVWVHLLSTTTRSEIQRWIELIRSWWRCRRQKTRDGRTLIEWRIPVPLRFSPCRWHRGRWWWRAAYNKVADVQLFLIARKTPLLHGWVNLQSVLVPL